MREAAKRSAAGSWSESLALPPEIHAVPGLEMNVYFANVFRASNLANFEFDVECAKGRLDSKRWRFVPSDDDVGVFKWKLTVRLNDVPVASGEAELRVSPRDAGKGRSISYLAVGDSITAASAWPSRLLELTRKQGSPELRMAGSRAYGKRAVPGGVAHEGYGGWVHGDFLRRDDSPFRFDGKLNFDAWRETRNGGEAPDFISVMLGTNTAYLAKDDAIQEAVDSMLADMDELLGEFRRSCPDAEIGVALACPCAASQDAFGANYNCECGRMKYLRAQFAINKATMARTKELGDPRMSTIPSVVNIDGENSFPLAEEPVSAASSAKILRQANALHPSEAGHIQYGDVFYAWLKRRLWLQEIEKLRNAN